MPKLPAAFQIADALDPDAFELILLPTEKCNFRCVYCYEDFSIGKMRPGVVRGIKELISRRAPALRRLHVSWFGGEPLLARDVCTDISAHAQLLCQKHGVAYASSMTTNGYHLDIETLSRLNEAGVRHFQISLDGDEDWHDQTRILANGKGSFARVIANLEAALYTNYDFHMTLRVHVHPRNIESVSRLVERLRSRHLKDPRFSLFFHKIENLGGEAAKYLTLSRTEYEAALRDLQNGAGNDNSYHQGRSELDLEGYICYASKPNSLLVRADGRLGKCTVILNDPRNVIGAIDENGRLEISDSRFQAWLEGFRDLDPALLGCPVRGLSNQAGPRSTSTQTSDRIIPAILEV